MALRSVVWHWLLFFPDYKKVLELDSTQVAARQAVVVSRRTDSYIVEPPNKGHFRAGHVVLCREVVLFSEVQMY